MVYECTCLNTEISISQVIFSNDIDKFKRVPENQRDTEVYLGPDFVSLPEEIQKPLGSYLVNSGVDQQTAAFIEIMSLDKEQRLYMKWLRDVEGFVDESKIL